VGNPAGIVVGAGNKPVVQRLVSSTMLFVYDCTYSFSCCALDGRRDLLLHVTLPCCVVTCEKQSLPIEGKTQPRNRNWRYQLLSPIPWYSKD
jgi:hypothetical protein